MTGTAALYAPYVWPQRCNLVATRKGMDVLDPVEDAFQRNVGIQYRHQPPAVLKVQLLGYVMDICMSTQHPSKRLNTMTCQAQSRSCWIKSQRPCKVMCRSRNLLRVPWPTLCKILWISTPANLPGRTFSACRDSYCLAYVRHCASVCTCIAFQVCVTAS